MSYGSPQKSGFVVWITGLSGAGKTTLAQALSEQMKAGGVPVVVLDGDQLREILRADTFSGDHHTRSNRLRLALIYARLCQELANQGVNVIIATISMFREVQSWNRANIENYFEIYLRVPYEELRRRDPKGIYRRFDAGEISNVAGLDFSVDEPGAPNFLVDFDQKLNVHQVANAAVQLLCDRFDWLQIKSSVRNED